MTSIKKNNVMIPAITTSSVVSPIDTSGLFEHGYSEPELSPIDQYFENNQALNVIALTGTFSQQKASIVLMGYMSAVESYFRALLRGIICVDEPSQKLVENMDIPYAAAVHHKNDLLPEALFEGTSLANPKNIKDAIRDHIGIKGEPPSDVQKVLKEFGKICELRHCCTHRFGKLGSKNAVRLGLNDHSELLEKPLHLNPQNLEDISFILRSLVNTFNSYIYENLLTRMAKNKDEKGQPMYSSSWSWNYTKDKKRFSNYYQLFSSTKDIAPSPDMKIIYFAYRDKYK